MSRAYDWIAEEVCAGSRYAVAAGFDCEDPRHPIPAADDVACLGFRNRRSCEERPDCYWTGSVCLRNYDVPQTARPTFPPTRRPTPRFTPFSNDDDDTGHSIATSCTGTRNKYECRNNPRCYWKKGKCRDEDASKPAVGPMPTRWPTRRPEAPRPTRRPTRRPEASPPTRRPTRRPAAPPPTTRWPTRWPTRRPTRRPEAPQPMRWPTRRPAPFPTRRPIQYSDDENGGGTSSNTVSCDTITNKHVCKSQAGCSWRHGVCSDKSALGTPGLQSAQSVM